jgi:hypothetical protein
MRSKFLIGPMVSDVCKGIDLTSFDSLEELKLSTWELKKLLPILRTISSNDLRSIQLLLLSGILEPSFANPREWALVDFELCALADHLHSARGRDCVSLEVRLVGDSERAGLDLVKFAKELLPESQKHRFISLA